MRGGSRGVQSSKLKDKKGVVGSFRPNCTEPKTSRGLRLRRAVHAWTCFVAGSRSKPREPRPPISVGGVGQLPQRQGAFSYWRCFALGETSNKPLDTDESTTACSRI